MIEYLSSSLIVICFFFCDIGRSVVVKTLCRKCTPLSNVLVNILKKSLLTGFFSNDMIQLCTGFQQKSAGVSFFG